MKNILTKLKADKIKACETCGCHTDYFCRGYITALEAIEKIIEKNIDK